MSSLPLTTAELFRSHGAFVRRLLGQLGLPFEVADDAVQDVFLVVHRHGGYRPGAAKPTTYLTRIAMYVAHEHRQRRRIAASRFVDIDAEQLGSCGGDPSRALQVRRDLGRLRLALGCLPAALCQTVLLVDVDGESCVSVAAKLRLPVGTVYSRQHAAHKRIQAIATCLETQQSARAVPDNRRSGTLAAVLAWRGCAGPD